MLPRTPPTVSRDIVSDVDGIGSAATELTDSSREVNVNTDQLNGFAVKLKEMVGKFRI